MADSGNNAWLFLLGAVLIWNMTPASVTVYRYDCGTGASISGEPHSEMIFRFNPSSRSGLYQETLNGITGSDFMECHFLDTDNWSCRSIRDTAYGSDAIGGIWHGIAGNAIASCGMTRWHRFIGQYIDIAESFISEKL